MMAGTRRPDRPDRTPFARVSRLRMLNKSGGDVREAATNSTNGGGRPRRFDRFDRFQAGDDVAGNLVRSAGMIGGRGTLAKRAKCFLCLKWCKDTFLSQR